MNSGRWWWTGRPGMLRFMGSQRVGHDWATELNWTELSHSTSWCFNFSIYKPNIRWKLIWKSPFSSYLVKNLRRMTELMLFYRKSNEKALCYCKQALPNIKKKLWSTTLVCVSEINLKRSFLYIMFYTNRFVLW